MRRPTAIISGNPPPAATAVVSVNLVGTRYVAYSYAFSDLDMRVPTNFAGTFSVQSTRVSTYEGPWDVGYPIASVMTFLNSATTSAGNFNYAAGVWESAPVNNAWFVKVEVQGYQQAAKGAPLTAMTLTWNCPVTVQPTPTPVLTR